MKNADYKLINKNLKPTAMRELVLDALMEQRMAVSLSDLEKMFDKVDKTTLCKPRNYTVDVGKLKRHSEP